MHQFHRQDNTYRGLWYSRWAPVGTRNSPKDPPVTLKIVCVCGWVSGCVCGGGGGGTVHFVPNHLHLPSSGCASPDFTPRKKKKSNYNCSFLLFIYSLRFKDTGHFTVGLIDNFLIHKYDQFYCLVLTQYQFMHLSYSIAKQCTYLFIFKYLWRYVFYLDHREICQCCFRTPCIQMNCKPKCFL